MLKLNNVSVKFGGLIAVNELSLEVEKNTIFGLIGPNGAGKTTAFNAISGYIRPTSGEIWFNDKKIDGLHPFQINSLGLARTYQNINLFKNMTVLENVMAGRHPRTTAGLLAAIFRPGSQRKEEQQIAAKAHEILKFLGIDDKAAFMAKNLSYGEQRLLEISRAMATEPELLLLDEPAAGMNTSEKEALKQLLKKIKEQGITILLVEHDMRLVMGITDQVCVLNYGKKIALGEPYAIQNNPDVIEAYLGGE
jgi:branched-chain amino acid transport system ATP-binding protein